MSTLRLPRLLNVIYAWWTAGMASKQRDEFDRFLDDLDRTSEEQRDAWGTGTQAEAGQNAMLTMLGAG